MDKVDKIYFYGIIFDVSGDIENIDAESETISFIPYKDIAAVVSYSDIIVKPDNVNKKIVAQQLLKHQKIIEHVMGMGHTIIPMKLCTYIENEDMVIELLRSGYKILKKIENEANNKIEVDIIAVWAEFGEVIKKLLENEDIRSAKEKFEAKPDGATVEDQKALGFLISGILKKKNTVVAEKCYKFLKEYFISTKKHDVMDDQMIFNTSFLVDRDKIENFNEAVDTLDEQQNDKINFRYVGPLPCYSFYGLETVNIDFDSLIRSRDILDLGESADLKEIKKKYKKKALISHPDKMGKMKSFEEFNEISNAYKYLVDLFCALKTADPDFRKIVFSREFYDRKHILIKLKD